MTEWMDPKKFRSGPEPSAIIAGHYAIRRKMAERIEELERLVRKLNQELHTLRESKDGSCIPLCDDDRSRG
jgi:hypothetical protein